MTHRDKPHQILRSLDRLARDIIGYCGPWPFLGATGLALAAAALEGAGLLLLLPLLQILGLSGSGGADFPMAKEAGRLLGTGGALIVYVLFAGIAGGVVYLRTVVGSALALRYVDRLRSELHQAVMSMAWASRLRQADVVHALTAEVGQSGAAVESSTALLAFGFKVPFLLAAAAFVSPAFTALAVALVVVVALILRPLNTQANRLGHETASANRKLHAEVADELAGLRLLKILGAETVRGALFADKANRLRRARHEQTRTIARIRWFQEATAVGAVAVCLFAGQRLLNLDFGGMLVLLALFGRIIGAAWNVEAKWRGLLRLLPIHDALAGTLDAAERAMEPKPSLPFPPLRRRIELEAVGFRHSGQGSAGLYGITITLPALSVTALTGPSGAGKSTLADLIMGLSAPDEGRILVDGVPLEGGHRVAWRARVGYVPQDPFLFHDTLKANLHLANPRATDADLWEVLDLAEAGFVKELPRGLETVVGDRGTSLSGGERQRIALAGALLRKPDLLVLDEATNALDEENEQRILEKLTHLRGRLTVLLIAHRPSTLSIADTVIELDGGRLKRLRSNSAAC